MSYQFQLSTQLSKNECCYVLGTTLSFSCLFGVLETLLDHISFGHNFPFQCTYVEHLLLGNGKKLANE